jgi:hypothetical protein
MEIINLKKLTIIQNDGNRYRLSNGQYITIDVMHKNCEFPLDMLDAYGCLKDGCEIDFVEMMNKNGKVVLYPDHSLYHKNKSLGSISRTKPLTESAPFAPAGIMKDISPYAKVSESETLEYKSSFAERDKIIETIVAFRNIRKAGTIIVGVDNEGNIKGEKRTKQQCIDVETDFLNTVRQVKCNVKLENYIEFDWCDEGRTCHISVKRAFDNKITYFKDELVVRNGASNISLKSEEMENFIINFYSLNL